MLHQLKLLQKQPESGNNESEPHQGQTGANPGKEGSFGGQVITQVGSLPGFRRRIHSALLARPYFPASRSAYNWRSLEVMARCQDRHRFQEAEESRAH
jgi:hypothetical protein